MPKHTNVVRFCVKAGKQSYVAYGLWDSEEKMVNARPQTINLLDNTRDLFEELSPELGVTDPVSGTVVFQKNID